MEGRQFLKPSIMGANQNQTEIAIDPSLLCLRTWGQFYDNQPRIRLFGEAEGEKNEPLYSPLSKSKYNK